MFRPTAATATSSSTSTAVSAIPVPFLTQHLIHVEEEKNETFYRIIFTESRNRGGQDILGDFFNYYTANTKSKINSLQVTNCELSISSKDVGKFQEQLLLLPIKKPINWHHEIVDSLTRMKTAHENKNDQLKWSCSTCTLINCAGQESCFVCLTPAPRSSDAQTANNKVSTHVTTLFSLGVIDLPVKCLRDEINFINLHFTNEAQANNFSRAIYRLDIHEANNDFKLPAYNPTSNTWVLSVGQLNYLQILSHCPRLKISNDPDVQLEEMILKETTLSQGEEKGSGERFNARRVAISQAYSSTRLSLQDLPLGIPRYLCLKDIIINKKDHPLHKSLSIKVSLSIFSSDVAMDRIKKEIEKLDKLLPIAPAKQSTSLRKWISSSSTSG